MQAQRTERLTGGTCGYSSTRFRRVLSMRFPVRFTLWETIDNNGLLHWQPQWFRAILSHVFSLLLCFLGCIVKIFRSYSLRAYFFLVTERDVAYAYAKQLTGEATELKLYCCFVSVGSGAKLCALSCSKTMWIEHVCALKELQRCAALRHIQYVMLPTKIRTIAQHLLGPTYHAWLHPQFFYM